MEILLKEDIQKLGKRGEIVKVRDGFARNYLIPRNLAVKIDRANVKMLAAERGIIERKNRKSRAEQNAIADSIRQVELEFVERAHEGVLYGSVTVTEIVAQLNGFGFSIEPRQVVLEENLKTIGTHSIPVKLKDGVQTSLTVHIIEGE